MAAHTTKITEAPLTNADVAHALRVAKFINVGLDKIERMHGQLPDEMSTFQVRQPQSLGMLAAQLRDIAAECTTLARLISQEG